MPASMDCRDTPRLDRAQARRARVSGQSEGPAKLASVDLS